MDIIIPTLGRIKTQTTFNNLPARWKEKVQFVVQSHEYEAFCDAHGSRHVHSLPESIVTIAATREWIHNKYKGGRYFVCDDDLDFRVREPNEDGDTAWKTRDNTTEDFDDMFDLIEEWMDEGVSHGALATTWVLPTLAIYPYNENSKIMTNVFYDGPKIPDNIQWGRVPFAEDFDVNLQLLTQGFKNRVSRKYIVAPGDTNQEGGCSTLRTLESHNASQLLLKELWPDFVRIKEKVATTGAWKGKTKLGTVIQAKKAYLSSIT